MLEGLSKFASPQVEQLFTRLQADARSYEAEMREDNRETLVIPVKLITADGEFRIGAFSRDVSNRGIGVITPQPFSASSKMFVELELHNGKVCQEATCRWCDSFGHAYWSSGWELNNATFDVELIQQIDVMVNNDARRCPREKFAIPVVVHQKGNLPRINAFTRNMSGEGVSLVTRQHLPESTFCLLEFMQSDGERHELIAQCVWTKRYSNSHWMSGWQFPKLERVAKFHESCFNR